MDEPLRLADEVEDGGSQHAPDRLRVASRRGLQGVRSLGAALGLRVVADQAQERGHVAPRRFGERGVTDRRRQIRDETRPQLGAPDDLRDQYFVSLACVIEQRCEDSRVVGIVAQHLDEARHRAWDVPLDEREIRQVLSIEQLAPASEERARLVESPPEERAYRVLARGLRVLRVDRLDRYELHSAQLCER
jgi:hypothetical protein